MIIVVNREDIGVLNFLSSEIKEFFVLVVNSILFGIMIIIGDVIDIFIVYVCFY